MNELQNRLFTMLCEIDDICSKHGITYYLAAGGALGAIRNGGFLPWDDDLDLYITRDNWEKLKPILDREVPDNRNFIYLGKNPYYCNPIGRYVDRESTFQMRSQLISGECGGLFVEFFVFDPLPTDEEAKLRHKKTLKLYTELLAPFFSYNHRMTVTNEDFDPELFVKYHERMKIEGRDCVLKELQDVLESTDDSECEEYCMRFGKITYIFPKESFGKGRRVKFEGREFPVTEQVERVLRLSYGDSWMCVPSLGNRVTHSVGEDISTPYQQYVDIYMPRIDIEDYIDACYTVKRNICNNISNSTELYRTNADIKLRIARNKFMLEGCSVQKLQQLLDNKDYEALKNSFSVIDNVQSDSTVSMMGGVIDIDDSCLEIYFRYLVETDSYYKAAGLLKKIEKVKPLSSRMEELKLICDGCRMISKAIFDQKDEDRVKEAIDFVEFDERIPDHMIANLWLERKKADESEEYSGLLEMAKEASERFKHSGNVIAYYAYALYKTGSISAAREKYEDACEKTNNAFVWKEAFENVGIDMYAVSADDGDPLENEILSLYGELFTLCRDNNLTCIATGQLLKRAIGMKEAPIAEANVAMPFGHIEKLAELVNLRIPNRNIEDYGNGFELAYCNTSSALISISRYRGEKRHSIKIGILPIESMNHALRRRKAVIINKLYVANITRTEEIKNKKKVPLYHAARGITRMLGEENIRRKAFDEYKLAIGLDSFDSQYDSDFRIGKEVFRSRDSLKINETSYNGYTFNWFDGLEDAKVKNERRSNGESDVVLIDFDHDYELLSDKEVEKLINKAIISRRKFKETRNVDEGAFKRKRYAWDVFNMSKNIIKMKKSLNEIDVSDINSPATIEIIKQYKKHTDTWKDKGIDYLQIDELEALIER